jgi:mRNA-degrading endonuclease toxin of MazEF toxin-antitoxin module
MTNSEARLAWDPEVARRVPPRQQRPSTVIANPMCLRRGPRVTAVPHSQTAKDSGLMLKTWVFRRTLRPRSRFRFV